MIGNKYALLILVCIGLAGCAPTLGLSSVNKSGTIRVGFPTAPDVADIPSILAFDLLRAQGYTVEELDYESPELVVAALADGAIDISNGSTRTHWAAAQKGADIVTLMQQAGDEWSLVTVADMKACPDLEGKRFGVQSAGSISNALLNAYIKVYCPDVTPQVLFVVGSDNRSVALQAGELDGTLMEISDRLQLELDAPGKYPTLITFAEALPQLKTTAIYTSSKFAREHPELVRDYLRAVLTTHRNIRANRAALYAGLKEHLKMDDATAKRVGDAYIERGIWDVNGGLAEEDIKYSLEFFQQTGSVEPGLDAAKITDLTFLDSVLGELGRQ